MRRRDDLSGIVPKIRLLPEALISEEELTMGVSAPGRAMAARWIHTGHSAVNLAQVCRIEYRRNDVSCKEICGFDLYLVDGTAVTLYWGDAGFEQVAEELREQGIELILGPAAKG